MSWTARARSCSSPRGPWPITISACWWSRPWRRLPSEPDLLVVVTAGGRPVEDIPGPIPVNARVARYLPFEWILPKTDLLVTNGGYGSVNQAMSYGIPLVTAGLTQDKADVNARVAWSGVGIDLATNAPTPEALRQAVRSVLDTQHYNSRAAAMADEFDGIDTRSRDPAHRRRGFEFVGGEWRAAQRRGRRAWLLRVMSRQVVGVRFPGMPIPRAATARAGQAMRVASGTGPCRNSGSIDSPAGQTYNRLHEILPRAAHRDGRRTRSTPPCRHLSRRSGGLQPSHGRGRDGNLGGPPAPPSRGAGAAGQPAWRPDLQADGRWHAGGIPQRGRCRAMRRGHPEGDGGGECSTAGERAALAADRRQSGRCHGGGQRSLRRWRKSGSPAGGPGRARWDLSFRSGPSPCRPEAAARLPRPGRTIRQEFRSAGPRL